MWQWRFDLKGLDRPIVDTNNIIKTGESFIFTKLKKIWVFLLKIGLILTCFKVISREYNMIGVNLVRIWLIHILADYILDTRANILQNMGFLCKNM